MATRSFLKDVIIKDKKSVATFIDALENAEGKKRKKVVIDKLVEDISDKQTIRKIFE